MPVLQALSVAKQTPLRPARKRRQKIKVTATAMIDGKEITKAVNSFDKILLGGAPHLVGGRARLTMPRILISSRSQ